MLTHKTNGIMFLYEDLKQNILEDNKEGKWITINGTHIFVNDKGRVEKGPGDIKDVVNKPDKVANDNKDKLLGPDNDMEIQKDKNGDLELKHKDLEDTVKLEGPGIGDLIIGFTSYIDVISAATMKVTRAMALNLGKALEQLKDALEQWQGS